MRDGDFSTMIHYDSLGPDSSLSVPTPDHYLPMLTVLGTKAANETLAFPVEGYEGGALSMLSVKVG